MFGASLPGMANCKTKRDTFVRLILSAIKNKTPISAEIVKATLAGEPNNG